MKAARCEQRRPDAAMPQATISAPSGPPYSTAEYYLIGALIGYYILTSCLPVALPGSFISCQSTQPIINQLLEHEGRSHIKTRL